MDDKDVKSKLKDRGAGFWMVVAGVIGALLIIVLVLILNLVYD